jgi:hypothetical protein
MSMLSLFAVLPTILAIALISVLVLIKKIQYPSEVVWGSILGKVVPARAHLVLDYNKQLDDEEHTEGWAGRKERRHQFKVNWKFLLSETKNTTLFLQTLRFEKLKIKESKRGMQYDVQEMAIVALIDEATELRWQQVRWQVNVQLRSKLGLQIDRSMFLTLLVYYKNLEKGMVALAEVEGKWLKDMLLERLGLTEWRLIEGGQSGTDFA